MTEFRKCDNCGLEYEPEYYELLETRLLIGQGFCPACRKIKYAEIEAQREATRLAWIAAERRRRRLTCGIPRKFYTQDFSTFEKGWQDKALDVCSKYADAFPLEKRPQGTASLYLYSSDSYGVGKTHLSCAIAHRIIERWNGERDLIPIMYFVSEPDLFRSIQATYSFTSEEKQVRESEDDIIKRLTYADLLILDDVGKERRQDPRFIQRTLFSLIDGRYRLELPMILTANLDPDQLRAHLEDASFDRLCEMIKGTYVNMNGKSYRRK